jgi:hypothetical protein
VGLFDFFKRRRERESAVQLPSSAATGPATQSVIGQQVASGAGFDPSSFDMQAPGMLESLQALTELGPALQKAMAEGNVTVTQGPSQSIDMRGTELGAEIREIIKQHGTDPDGQGQSGQSIDAAGFGDMQQQILAALAKHGIDPTGGAGTTPDQGNT